MTAYFDDLSQEVARLDADTQGYDKIREIEYRLVHDVNVCVQMGGFPLDLQRAVDVLVLTKGIYTQPSCLPPGDAEDFADHKRKLINLSESLHTVFHNVARLGLERFSDSPTTPVRCMAADSENRQDDMAAALVLLNRILPWLMEQNDD